MIFKLFRLFSSLLIRKFSKNSNSTNIDIASNSKKDDEGQNYILEKTASPTDSQFSIDSLGRVVPSRHKHSIILGLKSSSSKKQEAEPNKQEPKNQDHKQSTGNDVSMKKNTTSILRTNTSTYQKEEYVDKEDDREDKPETEKKPEKVIRKRSLASFSQNYGLNSTERVYQPETPKSNETVDPARVKTQSSIKFNEIKEPSSSQQRSDPESSRNTSKISSIRFTKEEIDERFATKSKNKNDTKEKPDDKTLTTDKNQSPPPEREDSLDSLGSLKGLASLSTFFTYSNASARTSHDEKPSVDYGKRMRQSSIKYSDLKQDNSHGAGADRKRSSVDADKRAVDQHIERQSFINDIPSSSSHKVLKKPEEEVYTSNFTIPGPPNNSAFTRHNISLSIVENESSEVRQIRGTADGVDILSEYILPDWEGATTNQGLHAVPISEVDDYDSDDDSIGLTIDPNGKVVIKKK